MDTILENRRKINDKELLSRIAKGDEYAFRQLFDELEGSLLYFAEQLIQQRQQAEDNVLIAFQKFWERREGFTSIEAVRAFLYTTVRNQGLNYLKREGMVEMTHRLLLKDAPESEDYIEYRMLQSELLHVIYREIQALPFKHRQMLEWAYLEELSTAEIARRLSLEESSVRAAKTRAMAQLRKSLSEKKILEITLVLLSLWQNRDAVS